jgi:myo-inositol catabolism protein IolC
VRDLLWVLAFDHRESLRRSFFGITGQATEDDDARAREAKEITFDGAVQAIEIGIPEGEPAVLVDEEYGAAVISRAREHGIRFAVPVEASGTKLLEFEHGDSGFGEAIERVDPTVVKVLLRYNPAADADDNRAQRDRLVMLQRWVSNHGREWMLELIVPAAPRQLDEVGGDTERYDVELRPALTVQAITELRERGLAPELWKLEGMPTSPDYAAVAEACGADGDGSACLVLGRGADAAAVERWLELAAPVPAYRGFAIGRTLWWTPLREYFDGSIGRADAVQRIADNYLRMITVYRQARA